MTRKHLCFAVLTLAATVACSKSSQPSATTNSASPTSASANADGSTIKATAPTPQSPVNGQQPQSLDIVLTVSNASAKFAGGMSPTYRFQVFNAGGTLAY